MKCEVRYTNGVRGLTFCSIREAVHQLVADFPDAVIVDAGGHEVGPSTPDDRYDVRSGRIALVWENAEDAGPPGLGDDGSKAAAEIVEA